MLTSLNGLHLCKFKSDDQLIYQVYNKFDTFIFQWGTVNITQD